MKRKKWADRHLPPYGDREAKLIAICDRLNPAQRPDIPRLVCDLVRSVDTDQALRQRHRMLGIKFIGSKAALKELGDLRTAAIALNQCLASLNADARLALPSGISVAALEQELDELISGTTVASQRLANGEQLKRPSHKRKDSDVQIAKMLLALYAKLTGIAGRRSNDAITGKPNGYALKFLEEVAQLFSVNTTAANLKDGIYRRELRGRE